MHPRIPAVLIVPLIAVALIWSVRLQADRTAGGGQPDQSPRALFERARMLEESNNKLTDAIRLYTQVAAQSADRQLAAAAQLRIGLLHERLGQKAEAQRAFRAVVDRYADQSDIVRQAKERFSAAAPPPGGLSARQVWAGLTAAPLGTTSGDGRYLSLTDWTDGSLAVRDLTTGAMRKLTRGGITQGFAYGSVFAPDGGSIAFNWIHQPSSALELRVMRVETQAERVLYRNDQLRYFQPFDWSQDGTRLLMLFSRLDGTNQIAVLSVADGSTQILKTLDWRSPATMRFSPDGRWILYDFPSRDQAPERDVFLLAADGRRETRIVDHPANDEVLGWSPDGKTLLFVSDRTGAPGAWTLQLADGAPAGAPQLLRADLSARLRPLGLTRAGAFYYFASTSVRDVYTADFDLGAGRPIGSPSPMLSRFVGGYESADWSPDGRRLAVITQPPGLGDKRLLIHSADGDREIPLQLSPVNWPRWSPDGRSILVSGRDRKNRRGFFRVDVHSGATTELLLEPAGNSMRMRAAWAQDGKSILYARRTDECLCVIRRDLSTGMEHTILHTPGSDRMMTIAPSPDGTRVAVLSFDEGRQRPVLSVVPAAGGPTRALYEAEDLAWFSLLDWTPDSGAILFGRNGSPEPGKIGVWRVPAEGGDPSSLALAMEGLRDLRLRSDGRRLAFTAGVDKGDVWMMENFLPASTRAPGSIGR
jgi:Tol biopolymer transport system component